MSEVRGVICAHNNPDNAHHNPAEPAGIETLKHQYLAALHSIASGISKLRDVVVKLADMDVDRDEMVLWAVEAGYTDSYVRSLISQVLIELGKRERAPGAGRRTPPEAIKLMDEAFDRYGAEAPKILLAAYRAAKKRVE